MTNSFMVVAKFKDEVTLDDIRPLIPAEQAQAKLLESQGSIGAIKISLPKRTTFIEAFGEDEAKINQTISTLPMAVLWNIEIFPTTPPAGPGL